MCIRDSIRGKNINSNTNNYKKILNQTAVYSSNQPDSLMENLQKNDIKYKNSNDQISSKNQKKTVLANLLNNPKQQPIQSPLLQYNSNKQKHQINYQQYEKRKQIIN
eukprot:TRINITY_DN6362_c0_g1_i4.p2 TRINITY_DN6362_c0_g1~~TRINITY_DN6362_c0_g1_i4.p2  ORF type:complete len:107 (+),score=22.45 TRINITY_DN6362_c0_g1_i4:167-487(+)